jgi:HSP20 family protein
MMDVADLGNKYGMKVEILGIPKEKINIDVTPNAIEISAKHDTTENDKKKNWLRRVRSSMSYYRGAEFPAEIKSDQVKAEFKDGVLTLALLKVISKPEYKSTKVKIK